MTKSSLHRRMRKHYGIVGNRPRQVIVGEAEQPEQEPLRLKPLSQAIRTILFLEHHGLVNKPKNL